VLEVFGTGRNKATRLSSDGVGSLGMFLYNTSLLSNLEF
jgi:hypothetical protein